MEDVQTIRFMTLKVYDIILHFDTLLCIWTIVSFKQEVESVVSGFAAEDSIALPWRGTV